MTDIRAPQAGPENRCRGKSVEKPQKMILDTFGRFSILSALRENCRKVSIISLTLLTIFGVF